MEIDFGNATVETVTGGGSVVLVILAVNFIRRMFSGTNLQTHTDGGRISLIGELQQALKEERTNCADLERRNTELGTRLDQAYAERNKALEAAAEVTMLRRQVEDLSTELEKVRSMLSAAISRGFPANPLPEGGGV